MNNNDIVLENQHDNLKHILKIMRITTFIFFFSIMFSYAGNTHSQEATLSLHLKSTTLENACREIEKQTGHVFVFADNAEETLVQEIDIAANSQTVSSVLHQMLLNTGLQYKIVDKQIIIFKDENIETSTSHTAASSLHPFNRNRG